MRKFPKPCLVTSKCIEFEACRYNGLIIRSSIVANLKKFVDFIPVCPEVEIDLGIPRDPIHLEENQGQILLIQPSTGLDCTRDMLNFADSFLDNLKNVDGFILKNKSPSCGIKAVKLYSLGGQSRPKTDGVGLFAANVFKKFPKLPVEDEGRLRNFLLRENFLTRIYTLADYRENVENGNFQNLLEFHRKNKLLFLSYSQIYLHKLGRLVANSRNTSNHDLVNEYKLIMCKMIDIGPSPPANINVLMHAFGYFSKVLKRSEKSFFLESIEKYKQGRIPLLVVQNLLRSWIIRFDNDYLFDQTFFEPYPDELMEITFL